MMRNPMRLGALVVAVGLAVAIAVPVFAADEATVGYFIVELAKAKRLNAADSQIAVDSLAAVGIRLPTDLSLGSPLTEGEVARLSRLVGVAVSTSRPESLFSRIQVDRFFNTFAGEMTQEPDDASEATVRSPTFNPYSKGKGKHKGKSKWAITPTEPE